MSKVFITGGAGYIGSILVPKVLERGYEVRILDLMIFGDKGLKKVKDSCEIVRGDIRNSDLIKKCLDGVESVIHLASIANDPCSDLNPLLTKEVNFEAAVNLGEIAKTKGVKRFLFASTGSVYGVKKELNITEESTTNPMTIYAKTKADAERELMKFNDKSFTTSALRSATVGGYSPRMRLDLIVNILTNSAINSGKVIVHGGEQMRPSIDIQDITDYYVGMLESPPEKIGGEVFNASCDNYSVKQIAETVCRIVGKNTAMEVQDTKDLRSYPMISEKIGRVLGFSPKYSLENTVEKLKDAFDRGYLPNPSDAIYRNIETMKKLQFK